MIQITGESAEEVRQLVADLAYALPRINEAQLPAITVVSTLNETAPGAPIVEVGTPKPTKPKKETKAETETKTEPTADKPVTIEMVRAALSVLSQNGKSSDVKSLIASYGATKLTEIDAANYADLLEKAVVI
jgi:hypothetical protein